MFSEKLSVRYSGSFSRSIHLWAGAITMQYKPEQAENGLRGLSDGNEICKLCSICANWSRYVNDDL